MVQSKVPINVNWQVSFDGERKKAKNFLFSQGCYTRRVLFQKACHPTSRNEPQIVVLVSIGYAWWDWFFKTELLNNEPLLFLTIRVSQCFDVGALFNLSV